jgi:hypothetical protein
MALSAPINAFYHPGISLYGRQAEVETAVRPKKFHAARALHGLVCFKRLAADFLAGMH